MTVEVTDNVRAVLDRIVDMTLNKCSATTYDLSVQECVRREIIIGLAKAYGIQYQIPYRAKDDFPVSENRNA